MKCNWEKLFINDCCKIEKKLIKPKSGEKYICYSLPAFDNSKTPELLDGEEIKSSKFILSENTILFNKLNPKFRRVWNVHSLETTENTICSTEFLPLKVNETIEQDFLYYYISSPYFTKLMNRIRTGTSNSQQRIDWRSFLQESIMVPSINIQKKIALFFKNIDDKIELNNKINNNLLEQSLCIYNSLIKGKLKNGCIGDYCSIKSGFAFKSAWWQDAGVSVVKIGSINQDCLNLSSCSYVSQDIIPAAKDFVVSGGDLLIAMTGATIGKFTMVPKTNKTILVNQRVGKFFLGNNPIQKIPFIYSTLKQPDIISEVINRGQGSAQPNISASEIMSIPCVIPKLEDVNAFNKRTSSMFELIISNQSENIFLSELRDTLLPKLMSGEIDVSKITI